jgi:CheY-like chemotaxis protein
MSLADGQAGPSGPACVLVVEDDPLLRRVLVRLLRGWGYGIVEAADGAEALERFREARGWLGLVVLDIMLPVIDGVQVARHVREAAPSLPILACSAAFTDQVQDDLRAAGVVDFLPKPYSADLLQRAVARSLPAAN